MINSFFINNIIFLLLFIGNLSIHNAKHYFQIIYLFLSIYHLFIFYTLYSNWRKNKNEITIFIIISIILYLFSYYIIYDTNPFFFILVYYIFFPNFLKAILIVLIHTYILSKFITSKNNHFFQIILNNNTVNLCKKEIASESENIINYENIPLKVINNQVDNNINSFKIPNYYFLCDYINYFSQHKLHLCIFLLFLVLFFSIEIKLFSIRIKLWVYFNDKTQTLPLSSSKKTKFYITAMIYNMEPIIKNYLLEMKKLINYLGEQNVIVSIVENGDSTDNTTIYLKEFEKYLNKKNITNKILLENEIEDPRHGEINFEIDYDSYLRIKYYSQLRNKCLDLLYSLPNIDFNNVKIIFFNDIIFEYENIINLLATNNEDYDAVCGLDFYDVFYDSWVSIDLSAYSLRHDFPYFVNKEGQDLVINHKPIRVFSCWNGVIAFSAAPLKDKNIKFRFELDPYREKINEIDTDQNFNFESECTYFHIDLFSLGYTKKFINPDVRVAYSFKYYNMKKDGYVNRKDIKSYFKSYFRSLFKSRNKDMSNYKDKNIRLNSVLEKWYLENKKNAFYVSLFNKVNSFKSFGLVFFHLIYFL